MEIAFSEFQDKCRKAIQHRERLNNMKPGETMNSDGTISSSGGFFAKLKQGAANLVKANEYRINIDAYNEVTDYGIVSLSDIMK